ncbi:MAG: hypothetical protein M3O35_18980, partial [Acidobacteriota bacterium]|nr:hypothetical protein [Acidobacteriota bacterium]
ITVSRAGIGRVDRMIVVAAIIVASIVTLMLVVALLCVAVYDPAQTPGISLKQRVAFCLRQLGSPWPWR